MFHDEFYSMICYYNPDKISSSNPATKKKNIAVTNALVPLGEFLNSFQINTPHNAAIKVAPCPNP